MHGILSAKTEVTCRCHVCEVDFLASRAAHAVTWALEHLEREHPEEYAKIDRAARLAARSDNGRGYWDSDSIDGWSKAQEGFREAHRQTVMRRSLGLL